MRSFFARKGFKRRGQEGLPSNRDRLKILTRDDFVQRLVNRYVTDEIEPNLYRFTLPLNSGRSQIVFVKVQDELFTVFSPIAYIESKDALEVLEDVSGQTVLGVSVISGAYCLMNSSTIFDEQYLRTWVATISNQADRLEARFSGGEDVL